MDSNELYRQLLGLSDPWTVERVELDVAQTHVEAADCSQPHERAQARSILNRSSPPCSAWILIAFDARYCPRLRSGR
jgi:hypothetical protein